MRYTSNAENRMTITATFFSIHWNSAKNSLQPYYAPKNKPHKLNTLYMYLWV